MLDTSGVLTTPGDKPRSSVRHARPRGVTARAGEFAVLRVWILTRVAVVFMVTAAAWINASPNLPDGKQPTDPGSQLSHWWHWDTAHYTDIARFGYFGAGNLDARSKADHASDAFFPGFPLAMRWVSDLTGLQVVWAGMLISLLATAVASVGIYRLAELEFGPVAAPPVAERAVLLMFLAPSAIFLTAAYSEPMFLAFAVAGWIAARRGAWYWAGLLAAGATATRPTGLFLIGALVVEFLTSRRRRLTAAPALLIPCLPPLAFMAFLHNHTGDWLEWRHAESRVWGRYSTWPWTSLDLNYHRATDPHLGTIYRAEYWLEIASLLVGLLLTIYLLRRRQWGEATFIGLTVAAFSTSAIYQSGARGVLLWWPLWITLSRESVRRPVIYRVCMTISAPLMAIYAVSFSRGLWAG